MNPVTHPTAADSLDRSSTREAPIEISPATFRELGHRLVDQIAEVLGTLPDRPVARDLAPAGVRALLPTGALPALGTDPRALLDETARILFEHSTYNGHPRFFAYITAGPTPIGILGDLLAAAVNPNVGAWPLAPVATEIEKQCVRWIAEMIGYPADCGGLFVSGGNVANLVCLLAARAATAPWDVKAEGVRPRPDTPPLALYASTETHTWIHKAVDICGLGMRAIRWIPADRRGRMRADALREQIDRDRHAGRVTPFLVVGTAGATGTGAIDPLAEIGEIARESRLWFHVDGAYGALAAALPEASADLRALVRADSVAVDPHKWLYAPLEAGCVLVRDAESLHRAFRHETPSYYDFGGEGDDPPTNLYDWGIQNSRGFRALKVWLALRQAGREGYVRMIRDDMALARLLFDVAAAHAELEAVTCELSITTFAYVPPDLRPGASSHDQSAVTEYLNELNAAVLSQTQREGVVYMSNALVDGRYLLRACIVNFRTSADDVRAVPEAVARVGRVLDQRLRPASLPRTR